MKVSSPFIQSVYSRRVRASANGSACAEKLALGVQYAWHTFQPLPASQASKNCLATAVMLDMSLSSSLYALNKKAFAVSSHARPSRRSHGRDSGSAEARNE